MQADTEKIIQQIKNGDQKAFRVLVENHQQYAFSLAFRILCDEDEAKDAVQESFIKIWRSIKNYDEKMKFTTWMYKIVTNTAIDRFRSIKRLNQVNIETVYEKLEKQNHHNPGVQLDNRETAQLIRIISETLPEKQKLVFVLRDLQGLDSCEVEDILNLPETSVKSNLYHARKVIREKLNKILSFERRLQ
ncbi:MAG: RNA polymerase sigma factor [Bacteroidales bacterium]|nr:RNA polymerase sigma factor [Bacteroidales bacterium]